MVKKIVAILILALSFSFLMADSLQLIGVDKKGSFPLSKIDLTGVKSIQSFIGGSLKSFDPSLPSNVWNDVQPFTSLKGGKGYWVILKDGYQGKTFTFSGTPISISDINLDSSQKLHLVALPSSSMADVVSSIKNLGYSIKSIQSFINGSLKSFDPSLPSNVWNDVQPFTSSEGGKGYWVITNGYIKPGDTTPPSLDVNSSIKPPMPSLQ